MQIVHARPRYVGVSALRGCSFEDSFHAAKSKPWLASATATQAVWFRL
jgi:hypothetical protein